MSQPLDEARVRHVARLARLHLSDDEVRLFAGQLGAILEYIDQLAELNVDDVEPMAHPLSVAGVLRDDMPCPSLTAEDALANAPDRLNGFFRVPTVIDQGAS